MLFKTLRPVRGSETIYSADQPAAPRPAGFLDRGSPLGPPVRAEKGSSAQHIICSNRETGYCGALYRLQPAPFNGHDAVLPQGLPRVRLGRPGLSVRRRPTGSPIPPTETASPSSPFPGVVQCRGRDL